VSSPFDSDVKREGTHLNNSEAPSEYKFDQQLAEEHFEQEKEDYRSWLAYLNPCSHCLWGSKRATMARKLAREFRMIYYDPCPVCTKPENYQDTLSILRMC